MSFLRNLLLVAPLLTPLTSAHLSIWTPAMFGSDPTNPNSDNASQPLVDRDFKGWWFHDNIGNPPQDPSAVVELPVGGQVKLEISSNKAFTSMGLGLKPNPEVAPEPWTNTGNGWGNMHANTREEVAGSALAIAYKSSATEVTPGDFVVFSVVYDSPARQLQAFPIPSSLPSCPNNRCICAWFWIHDSRGGGDEMYMTPFVCNVTGGSSDKKLGKPRAPQRCDGDGWDDQVKAQKGQCVKGAKSPMYWKNKEGMNMFEPGHWAPTYSAKYGFVDGAQEDIFEDGRVVGEEQEQEEEGTGEVKETEQAPAPAPETTTTLPSAPQATTTPSSVPETTTSPPPAPEATTTPPPAGCEAVPRETVMVTVTETARQRGRAVGGRWWF